MSERAAWALLASTFLLIPTSLAAAEDITWSLATRDVYLDGRLEPEARVYVSREPRLTAIVISDEPTAWVVDDEDGLGRMSSAALDLSADGLEAVSPDLTQTWQALAGARATSAGEAGLLLHAEGRTLLITSHQGQAGVTNADELWSTAPAWKALYDHYEPDPEAVAALRALDRDVELEVAFGTWCGDSRRDVPALLRTVEAAANPRITLRLVSLARGMEEPGHYIREQGLTNVPTIMVRAEGREIGRYVETPLGERVELDLARILAGEPYQAKTGHLERLSTLARGSYRYLRDGRVVARESFRLLAEEEGGRQLYSRLKEGERVTETRLRLDGEGRARFLEITRREGEEISRSRLSLSESGRLSGTTRGNGVGILRQSLQLPEGSFLAGPGLAGSALPWAAMGDGEHPLFLLGETGEPPAGELGPRAFTAGAEAEIETAAGRLESLLIETWDEDGEGRLWIHPELSLPLAAERGELRIELVEWVVGGEEG